jgi:hypothetical protein
LFSPLINNVLHKTPCSDQNFFTVLVVGKYNVKVPVFAKSILIASSHSRWCNVKRTLVRKRRREGEMERGQE